MQNEIKFSKWSSRLTYFFIRITTPFLIPGETIPLSQISDPEKVSTFIIESCRILGTLTIGILFSNPVLAGFYYGTIGITMEKLLRNKLRDRL